MPASQEYHTIRISDIKIGERDRKLIRNVETLAASIAKFGLIHPIVVTRDLRLVSGERRIEAFKSLSLEEIPAHYLDELDEYEIELVELDENLRRENLTWQEEATAVMRYHDIRCERDEDWTLDQTCEELRFAQTQASKYISVGRALTEDPDKIKGADGITAAFNIIQRHWHRAAAEEIGDIIQGTMEEDEVHAEIHSVEPGETDVIPVSEEEKDEPIKVRPAEKDIKVLDFAKWSAEYKGPKFNFLHVDFPYGISHEKSGMGGSRKQGDAMYKDSIEVYFDLLRAMCKNMDKFLLPSAHIMFWFSFRHYEMTLSILREMRPELVINDWPLIWHKSDGKGILADPERLPRYTYEAALFISRGDRRVVSPIFGSYAAPTGKSTATHVSQKPEPVLRHFFRLFIDDISTVLDPTCGSGTALVAAEALGAKRVFGMDINEIHVEDARRRLDAFRSIEAARKAAL